MSNRTLVELNHDYVPRDDELEAWAKKFQQFMRGLDKSILPRGVTWKHSRHYSEPDPLASVSEDAPATPPLMDWNIIGTLLDAWDGMPNDVKSDLLDQYPSFHNSIINLYKFVEAEPAAQPSEKEAKPWSLLRDLLDVTDLDERWMPEQKKRYDAVVERAEQALKKAGTK